MINILWYSRDYGSRASQIRRHIMYEISKYENVIFHYGPGNVYSILKKYESQLGIKFDVLMLDEISMTPAKGDINKINIPKFIWIEDMQWDPQFRYNYVIENEIDYIFTCYRQGTLIHGNKLLATNRCWWMPHSANTELYCTLPGVRKIYDVLFAGNYNSRGFGITSIYPMRDWFIKTLLPQPWFTCIKRPSFTLNKSNTKNNIYIRKEYTLLLNKTKIFMSCGSIWNYAVGKYFEVPACNTLVCSNWFEDLGLLGFKPDKNILIYDKGSLIDKLNNLRRNAAIREKMAAAGRQLIVEHHNNSIRAKQFINFFYKILGKNLKYSSIESTFPMPF